MKKMDEMDRNIQLRAEARGYRAAILALSAYILYNSYQTLANGAPHNPLPSLLLTLPLCVKTFTELALKQRMISGDEEYRPPNLILEYILTSLILTVLISVLCVLLIVYV